MKVFISYSQKDVLFVKRLEHFLQSNGVQVIDPKTGIRPGNNIFATINHGIEDADLVLMIFSYMSEKDELYTIELDLITSKIVNSSFKKVVPVIKEKYAILPPFIRQFQALDLTSSKSEDFSFKLIRDLIYFRSGAEIDQQDIEAEAELIQTQEIILKSEQEAYEYSKNKTSAYTAAIISIVLSIVNCLLLAGTIALGSAGKKFTIDKSIITPAFALSISVTLIVGIAIGAIISLIIRKRISK